MEGSLSLDSVTSIPEWFNPTVGGCLSLNRVDSIPESFNPTVGFDLGLGSLKNIPENWNPTNVKGKILIGGKKFRSGPHGMIMDNADFWNSSANSSLGITKTAAKWGRAGSGVLYYCPDDNTVMLLERSDAVEDPGLWGIPGGAIKGTEGMYDEKEDLDGEKFDDETLRSSAHTEVEEEIGHKPEGGKEMGQVTLSFGNFNYTTFIVSVDKEQKEAITNGAKLNWESIGINWFPLSQLPAKTHPGVSGAIKKFFGRKTKTAQNESGKLYWKAHLASDFKKGTPVKNNGVGEGGHVFSDFDKMINKLGRKWYWFAPIIMSNDEVVDEGNGVFEAKVSKSSIGDFAPVEYWEKHKETLNA
jgi:8-oxo-dGTP pyrophosphatase MutT (NUDIX family)